MSGIRRMLTLMTLLVVTLLLSSLAPSKAAAQGKPGTGVGILSHSSGWLAEYFPNMHLSGHPTLVTEEQRIDFNWGHGAPATLPGDYFSARFTRESFYEAGTYRFTTETDDGVRLFVDGVLVIDKWHQMAPTKHSTTVNLTRGNHTVRMEYFEQTLGAVARLTIERTDQTPPTNAWRGEYFNNTQLSGHPIVVRSDDKVGFNWGAGSPDTRISRDNFSARWTRDVYLQGGKYEFTTRSDDGVRLYVDGRIVIDRWYQMAPQTHTGTITVGEGWHTIRLEYFEAAGGAEVTLSWRGPIREHHVGNIVTCAGPAGSYSWVKVYRLESNGTWADVNPAGFGSIEQSGWLKVEGLSVDVGRYGGAGHPYRVEQYVNGSFVRSAEVRVYHNNDAYTPWQCGR